VEDLAGVTEVLAVVPTLAKDVEEARGMGAGAVTEMIRRFLA
jgi:hypothetical protein